MHIRNRVILGVLVAGVAIVLLAGTAAWWFLYRPMPQVSGTLRVPGLQAEVLVRRDRLGVPHISAHSLPDLYFAQGWVTAQDRLWQMDVLRRLAGGTLAEVAGQAAARSDAERRLLGMRRIAEAGTHNLPAEQRALLDSYVAGVNAYLGSSRGRLPLEFRLMRYQPKPWSAEDCVLVGLHMFQALTTTWRDELLKVMLIQRVGPQRARELLVTRSGRDHPPSQESQVPSPRSQVRLETGGWRLEALFPSSLQPPASSLSEGFPGSNNWVVSGAHTASGRAMLANDPHLEYAVPSVWYSVQLQAPGMNVAGVSLPGMPAVIIGHNEQIAWGVTNMGADVQDLYAETFDPEHPDRYLADGKWEQADVHRERIHIRGGGQMEFEVIVTRHGPIVLTQGAEKYALRWVAAERGIWTFPFFRLNGAKNWPEFTAALADYGGPAQNFVYADAAGNIGYQAAGKIPIRPRGDGSLPLPGNDSKNDWTGYILFDQLPHVYNPPSGMIATANGRVVPDDYRYPVATAWDSPDRTERIYQLLSTNRKFRPEDFTNIQTDIYSAHYKTMAGAFAAALERRRAGDPRARRLAVGLKAWNGSVSADSSEASLVHFARQELFRTLLVPAMGELYRSYHWRMSNVFLEDLLRERPARWLPARMPDFDEALATAVERAEQTLRERFHNDDPRQWPWGRIVATSFAHPIANQLPAILRYPFVVGPFVQAGNSNTVKQTTPALGPSMRMVVDFSNLDGTLLTLTMGESGHVFSRHYKDQFGAWYRGESLQFPFTEGAVSREAEGVLRLVP